MSSTIKLNKYTLLEKGEITKIIFYPIAAINETEITNNDSIRIIFEIESEKEFGVSCMRTSLIDYNGKKVYATYGLYLKEISSFRYSINENKFDIAHADVLPKWTIDFNSFDFEQFKKVFTSVDQLNAFLPELKNILVNSKEQLEKEQSIARIINIPTSTNYYQNVSGCIIKRIEDLVINKKEEEITLNILNNLKKNYEVILNSEEQHTTSLLSLCALLLNKVKSDTTKPKDILDIKELKTDTNKVSMKLDDLNNVLMRFIVNKKDDEDYNIIQERIEYALNEKSKLKEVTNYLKVILADEKYIDDTRRVRALSEEILKTLIIKGLANQDYHILPRNEVLIYNLVDEDNIDFITIVSLDKIFEIFKSYRLNAIDENKELIRNIKTIDKLYNKTKVSKEDELNVLIKELILINLFKKKNIDEDFLLFNKGDYILNFGYKNGLYNITINNKETKKEVARFIKLTEETKKEIKEALDKSEKAFISYMNDLIFYNLLYVIKNNKLNIEVNDFTHKDTKIIIKRPKSTDIFECNFTLEDLLIIFSNSKQKKNNKKANKEENSNYIYGINKKDYEYIMRKSASISEVMNNNPIKNKEYERITQIYNKFKTIDNKQKALMDLAKLLKIELIDIEEEN